MTRNKVTQKVKTGRGLKGVKRGIGVGKAVRTRGKKPRRASSRNKSNGFKSIT